MEGRILHRASTTWLGFVALVLIELSTVACYNTTYDRSVRNTFTNFSKATSASSALLLDDNAAIQVTYLTDPLTSPLNKATPGSRFGSSSGKFSPIFYSRTIVYTISSLGMSSDKSIRYIPTLKISVTGELSTVNDEALLTVSPVLRTTPLMVDSTSISRSRRDVSISTGSLSSNISTITAEDTQRSILNSKLNITENTKTLKQTSDQNLKPTTSSFFKNNGFEGNKTTDFQRRSSGIITTTLVKIPSKVRFKVDQTLTISQRHRGDEATDKLLSAQTTLKSSKHSPEKLRLKATKSPSLRNSGTVSQEQFEASESTTGDNWRRTSYSNIYETSFSIDPAKTSSMLIEHDYKANDTSRNWNPSHRKQIATELSSPPSTSSETRVVEQMPETLQRETTQLNMNIIKTSISINSSTTRTPLLQHTTSAPFEKTGIITPSESDYTTSVYDTSHFFFPVLSSISPGKTILRETIQIFQTTLNNDRFATRNFLATSLETNHGKSHDVLPTQSQISVTSTPFPIASVRERTVSQHTILTKSSRDPRSSFLSIIHSSQIISFSSFTTEPNKTELKTKTVSSVTELLRSLASHQIVSLTNEPRSTITNSEAKNHAVFSNSNSEFRVKTSFTNIPLVRNTVESIVPNESASPFLRVLSKNDVSSSERLLQETLTWSGSSSSITEGANSISRLTRFYAGVTKASQSRTISETLQTRLTIDSNVTANALFPRHSSIPRTTSLSETSSTHKDISSKESTIENMTPTYIVAPLSVFTLNSVIILNSHSQQTHQGNGSLMPRTNSAVMSSESIYIKPSLNTDSPTRAFSKMIDSVHGLHKTGKTTGSLLNTTVENPPQKLPHLVSVTAVDSSSVPQISTSSTSSKNGESVADTLTLNSSKVLVKTSEFESFIARSSQSLDTKTESKWSKVSLSTRINPGPLSTVDVYTRNIMNTSETRNDPASSPKQIQHSRTMLNSRSIPAVHLGSLSSPKLVFLLSKALSRTKVIVNMKSTVISKADTAANSIAGSDWVHARVSKTTSTHKTENISSVGNMGATLTTSRISHPSSTKVWNVLKSKSTPSQSILRPRSTLNASLTTANLSATKSAYKLPLESDTSVVQETSGATVIARRVSSSSIITARSSLNLTATTQIASKLSANAKASSKFTMVRNTSTIQNQVSLLEATPPLLNSSQTVNITSAATIIITLTQPNITRQPTIIHTCSISGKGQSGVTQFCYSESGERCACYGGTRLVKGNTTVTPCRNLLTEPQRRAVIAMKLETLVESELENLKNKTKDTIANLVTHACNNNSYQCVPVSANNFSSVIDGYTSLTSLPYQVSSLENSTALTDLNSMNLSRTVVTSENSLGNTVKHNKSISSVNSENANRIKPSRTMAGFPVNPSTKFKKRRRRQVGNIRAPVSVRVTPNDVIVVQMRPSKHSEPAVLAFFVKYHIVSESGDNETRLLAPDTLISILLNSTKYLERKLNVSIEDVDAWVSELISTKTTLTTATAFLPKTPTSSHSGNTN